MTASIVGLDVTAANINGFDVTPSNTVAAGDVLVLVETGAFTAGQRCTAFAGLGGTWTERAALSTTALGVWIGVGCTGAGTITGTGGATLSSVNRRRLMLWHLTDVSDTIADEDATATSGTSTTDSVDAELGQIVLAVGHTSSPPSNAITAYTPTTDWSEPAGVGTGAYNLTLDNVRYGKPISRVPAGGVESHSVSGFRSSGNATVAILVVGDAAPGVPTSVLVTDANDSSLELSWSAPSSGGAVTGYEVRIDGGSETADPSSPHVFTGLTGGTSYDLEVRAVGPGGVSSWVLVTESTTADTPADYYLVELEVGSHSWSFTHADPVDLTTGYPHVRLPLTLGWDIPDSVELFPAQPSMTTLGFAIQCDDASTLSDVVKGTTVKLRMYVDNDFDAPPWQRFDGIVSQLDGETVVSPADPDKRDFVVTVFATDDNARLADMFVGYGSDWPIEQIGDRVDRICTEAGIARINRGGPALGLGMVGWLPARTAGAPISALSAIQTAMKDSSDDYDSEPPDEFYGRRVFQYWHVDPDPDETDDEAVHIAVFRRRVYGTTTLDGGLVRAAGRWSKAPGPSAASWVIVDGTTFGTPDGTTPYVRNTGLLDYFGPGGVDPNYSAAERDALGESLLADGSTALDGWASKSLVYEASQPSADLDAVALWASPQYHRGYEATPVVITPIGPELEVNAEDYVAGTLTGARLIIPAGGKYRIEFRLRAELLPGTDLPA